MLAANQGINKSAGLPLRSASAITSKPTVSTARRLSLRCDWGLSESVLIIGSLKPVFIKLWPAS